MCGIAGYVVGGTAADRADRILAMVRSQAHRGPDDEGVALFDPPAGMALALRTEQTAAGSARGLPAAEGFAAPHRVALGHRRFSIVDLSPGGHQPFWSDDGSVCLTFNGEIYNHVELRRELESAGRRFRTTCDTEVLLQAYLEWGEDCWERLAGFWALALYDGRRRQVLLARDRLGKAPLYVTRSGGSLLWASEIKALRAAIGAAALPVRAQAVADFVSVGLRDVHDLTFYEGVRSFPRGSWAWVDGDGTYAPRRFWDLPERRMSERELAPREAIERLREVLTAAVRSRLRADVPVGVELSGGVDSSSLVALAAADGHRLHAFTVSFPGTEWDEEPYARAVAERWRDRVEYEVIQPEERDFFDNADWFIAHMDEPFHSPNMLTNQMVWREMAAHGIRVSINGGAGDELFAGYHATYHGPYLAWLLARGRLRRLHGEITRSSERPAPLGSALYRTRVRGAARAALRELAPAALRPRRGWHPPADGTLVGVPAPLRRPVGPIEQLIVDHMTDWRMNYWLRSGHQSFMGVPVEVRGPFLDHRVVECAMTLPLAYLIRDGWFKWILRQAARDVLPEEVAFRRAKMGFPFPLAAWLEGNRERFFSIARQASEPCPYVDLDVLEQSYSGLVRSDPSRLWRAMSVALWWQRCVLDEPLRP